MMAVQLRTLPQGFGFCDYRDPETAQSAQRNLNGRDMGGRQLRVDGAEVDKVCIPA